MINLSDLKELAGIFQICVADFPGRLKKSFRPSAGTFLILVLLEQSVRVLCRFWVLDAVYVLFSDHASLF